MSNGNFTERFMSEQREHFARLFDDSVRQIEALDLDDESARQVIEFTRAHLASHLNRIEQRIVALAARGMRSDDEALH